LRVQVTNLAGFTNPPAISLTVLPDTDGDGTPDSWEELYGFSATNAADATLDFDSDGVINRDEYVAGTDPTDAKSYLKLEPLILLGQTNVVLEFNAISNRSYTLQARDSFPGGGWSNYFNVLPEVTNRVIRITNSVAASRSFYRLATPLVP
jgi:hypothetical protein